MEKRMQEIIEILKTCGIKENEITLLSDGFRYSYWSTLPAKAFEAISHLVSEDDMEDDDGEDEDGASILLTLYFYKFKTS